MTALLALALFGPAPDPVEVRAVAYLSREVPAWQSENGCFSCHNDGDGVVALAAARDAGHPVDAHRLRPTLEWLSRPEAWDAAHDPTLDRRLARLQFAAALAAATRAGWIVDRGPLVTAANRLVADQEADGSFHPDGPESLGGPTTYGRAVATWLGLGVLRAADPRRFDPEIRRSEAYLAARPIDATQDAAVELLRGAAGGRRSRAIDRIDRAEASGGGFGPFPDTPAEPFDTALVLLAAAADGGGDRALIDRGRAYLAATQLDDGSWPETTRPGGGDSYAQRVSTTAWALRALVATRPAITTPRSRRRRRPRPRRRPCE